jgi:predicted nucleic acid-binding protein
MDVKTIKKAFELCEKYNILTNDAGIVASMRENDVDTIYTDNVRDFRKIDKIRVVNPVR